MADEKGLRSMYHLRLNPFDLRVQMNAPLVGRTKEQEVWKAIISSRAGARGSSLNFIVGDYGMGKTHALYHIKRHCDERGDVAAVILKLLSEDELRNFGVDFVRRVFKGMDEETKAALTKVKHPRIEGEMPDHAVVLRGYAKGSATATGVLTGEKVTKAELGKAGVRRTLDSTEIALEYLGGLLSMLTDAGKGSLVLCVDEGEYIFSQTSTRKAAQVFNSIRAMYDLPGGTPLGLKLEPIANMIFFFAISVSGMERLRNLEKVEQHQGGPIQPLLTRVDRTISLSRLSQAETSDLVAEYLKTSRTAEKKKLSDPLIPYDEDFVQYLYSLTKGHPRETVTRCDYVISEGLKEHVEKLTRKYAKEVFSRWNLST